MVTHVVTHIDEQALATDVPGVHPESRRRGAITPQLRRIAVPLDGSTFARAALAPAMELAALLGGDLVLVQAVVPAHVPGLDDDALAYQLGETDAFRSLADATAEARQRGLAAADVLVKGDLATRPADAIVTAASEFDAGLIAMATHGRSGISRAVLGSVAEEVVARARVPVLLVNPRIRHPSGAGRASGDPDPPAGEAPVPVVLRLAVALDGSPEAEASLETAVALAMPVGGEVHLVRVVEDPNQVAFVGRGPGEQAFTPERAERYLRSVVRRLRSSWIPPELLRTAVRPAAGEGVAGIAGTLLAYAREQDATMLVIATHARRGVARLLHGSVEGAVIAGADLPVLVVRATAQG